MLVGINFRLSDAVNFSIGNVLLVGGDNVVVLSALKCDISVKVAT